MGKIDIIEREDALIAVDEDGESYTYTVENSVITPEGNPPDRLTEHVLDATSNVLNDNVDWPIKIKTGHHLEDTVGMEIPRKLNNLMGGDKGYRYFKDNMGGRPSLPSIEIAEYWEVDENGNASLSHVEYDGTKYTPES